MTGSASTLKSLQSPRGGNKSLNLSHASIGYSATKLSGANSVFSTALKLARKPSRLVSPRATKPALMIPDQRAPLEPSLDQPRLVMPRSTSKGALTYAMLASERSL